MPNWTQKLSYCIANLFAVLAALYIAFWLDLDRPYWAMFTVFIVSKPISGAVRSKGVYRFVGTLIGASMSVFLVPPLVQSPLLLSLAVSVWVAACLYGALQDRTPRSYTFLLAGYSVAIVGLSTVNSPTAIFDVALSRLEEITIGIVCGAVAHSVFFPNNYGDLLRRKAESAIRQSAGIAAAAIGGAPQAPSLREISQLANTVTEIHTLYSQIGFETSNVRRAPAVMVGLLDRIALTLPKASLAYRALIERSRLGDIPEALRLTLDEAVSAFSAFSRGLRPNTDEILVDLEAVSEMLDEENATRANILELTCVTHTIDIIWALRQSMALAPGLTDGHASAGTNAFLPKTTARPLYRDRLLALLSAMSAAGATLVACFLWIETAWPEGFVAAQFAAICCSLFATLDNPSKVIGQAVAGIIIALPIAAIYVFAILPGVDGFASLALVLSPVLLLFSFLQTFERLEGAALVLAIAFSGALALQENFASDFAAFVNSNLAEICGPLIAIGMLLIFRTIDPVWNANRILKSAHRSVGDLADYEEDPAAWVMQIFDHVGLAAIRLAPAANVGSLDLLGDMRVGMNILALREVEDGFGAPLRGAAQKLTGQITKFCSVPARQVSSFAKGRAFDSAAALSSQLAAAPRTDEILRGLVAIEGLRMELISHSSQGAAA